MFILQHSNVETACIHVTKNVAPAGNTHGSNIRFSLMKGLYESTLASRIIVTTIKAKNGSTYR